MARSWSNRKMRCLCAAFHSLPFLCFILPVCAPTLLTAVPAIILGGLLLKQWLRWACLSIVDFHDADTSLASPQPSVQVWIKTCWFCAFSLEHPVLCLVRFTRGLMWLMTCFQNIRVLNKAYLSWDKKLFKGSIKFSQTDFNIIFILLCSSYLLRLKFPLCRTCHFFGSPHSHPSTFHVWEPCS